MPISTGSTLLPDVGESSYNGVVFSSLFKSSLSGNYLPDESGRTVRYVEYTLTLEGVATPSVFGPGSDSGVSLLRDALSRYGGALVYKGKGVGELVVNVPGKGLKDLAFGPKPKVLELQPLGGGRSALVKWQVTTCVPEVNQMSLSGDGGHTLSTVLQRQAPVTGGVVQFNEEIGIAYDDECYSTLTIRGTLEIPLTRRSVDDMTPQDTVDNYRQKFLDVGFDELRFRVTKRSFTHSRDRRTCTWEFVAEELPPMGLPPYCPHARGSFHVESSQQYGFVRWTCSLRATYTVRKDVTRRTAYDTFMSLLQFRMRESAQGRFPSLDDVRGVLPGPPRQQPGAAAGVFAGAGPGIVNYLKGIFAQEQQHLIRASDYQALLLSFEFDEGLYLDSKTTSFAATWQLLTVFSDILVASGVWRTTGVEGGENYAMSVRDIVGWMGVLDNRTEADRDVIIDVSGPVV